MFSLRVSIVLKWLCGLLLLGILSLGSCSKDDCQAGVITVEGLDDFNCPSAKILLSLSRDKDFELIRSQAQFESIVISSCNLSFDWQKYDLVVGRIKPGYIIAEITRKFSKDCVGNRATLSFDFLLTITPSDEEFIYSALIPKLSDQETLFVQT